MYETYLDKQTPSYITILIAKYWPIYQSFTICIFICLCAISSGYLVSVSDKQQSIHCQNILCEAAIQRVCVVEEKTSKEHWSGVSSFTKQMTV